MKTKFTMIMAVIATFAISLNLHSSNGKIAKWLLQALCVSVKMVNAAPE